MNKPLRNFGLITEKDYLGKELEVATKFAEDGGYLVRVVENNGVSNMVTMDHRGDRINFRVSRNIIVGVYGG
jgi:hypothetical protein